MPFQIIRNDITKVSADAIVNTANPHAVIGSGTDSAIYQAAGADELLAERKKIGDIPVGKAAVTSAFRLNARYIIHTVGPAWEDGKQRLQLQKEFWNRRKQSRPDLPALANHSKPLMNM